MGADSGGGSGSASQAGTSQAGTLLAGTLLVGTGCVRGHGDGGDLWPHSSRLGAWWGSSFEVASGESVRGGLAGAGLGLGTQPGDISDGVVLAVGGGQAAELGGAVFDE